MVNINEVKRNNVVASPIDGHLKVSNHGLPPAFLPRPPTRPHLSETSSPAWPYSTSLAFADSFNNNLGDGKLLTAGDFAFKPTLSRGAKTATLTQQLEQLKLARTENFLSAISAPSATPSPSSDPKPKPPSAPTFTANHRAAGDGEGGAGRKPIQPATEVATVTSSESSHQIQMHLPAAPSKGVGTKKGLFSFHLSNFPVIGLWHAGLPQQHRKHQSSYSVSSDERSVGMSVGSDFKPPKKAKQRTVKYANNAASSETELERNRTQPMQPADIVIPSPLFSFYISISISFLTIIHHFSNTPSVMRCMPFKGRVRGRRSWPRPTTKP